MKCPVFTPSIMLHGTMSVGTGKPSAEGCLTIFKRGICRVQCDKKEKEYAHEI